jgi:hypothetical protein
VDQCDVCGHELPEFGEASERTCPGCGKVTHLHKQTLEAVVRTSASIDSTVDRAVNETRMGGFALIVSIAVGVAVSVAIGSGVWLGLLSFAITVAVIAALLAAIYRVGWVRRFVMEVMHRITGQ